MTDVNTSFVNPTDDLLGTSLTFKIGEKLYGIQLVYVNEILPVQKVTRVPSVPAYIKGIINLRGRILPVIEVRSKFGLESIEYNETSCIISITYQDITVCLIVDSVADVVDMDAVSIADLPNFNLTHDSQYVSSISKSDNTLILNLDLNKLLSDSYGRI